MTTVKGLRKHFDQFGTVMEVSHGHKLRNSAKVQRGFAYIRMSCQEDYDAVVRAHESGHTHTLEGRLLDVRTQDTRQVGYQSTLATLSDSVHKHGGIYDQI